MNQHFNNFEESLQFAFKIILKSLESELSKYESEINDLKEQLKSKDDDVSQSANQMQSLINDLKKYEDGINNLMTENKELADLNNKLMEENNKLMKFKNNIINLLELDTGFDFNNLNKQNLLSYLENSNESKKNLTPDFNKINSNFSNYNAKLNNDSRVPQTTKNSTAKNNNYSVNFSKIQKFSLENSPRTKRTMNNDNIDNLIENLNSKFNKNEESLISQTPLNSQMSGSAQNIQNNKNCNNATKNFEDRIVQLKKKFKENSSSGTYAATNTISKTNSSSNIHNNIRNNHIYRENPEETISQNSKRYENKSNQFILSSKFFSDCKLCLRKEKYDELILIFNNLKENKISREEALENVQEILRNNKKLLKDFGNIFPEF